MPSETPALEPIKTNYRMNFLSDRQLDEFQEFCTAPFAPEGYEVSVHG